MCSLLGSCALQGTKNDLDIKSFAHQVFLLNLVKAPRPSISNVIGGNAV